MAQHSSIVHIIFACMLLSVKTKPSLAKREPSERESENCSSSSFISSATALPSSLRVAYKWEEKLHRADGFLCGSKEQIKGALLRPNPLDLSILSRRHTVTRERKRIQKEDAPAVAALTNKGFLSLCVAATARVEDHLATRNTHSRNSAASSVVAGATEERGHNPTFCLLDLTRNGAVGIDRARAEFNSDFYVFSFFLLRAVQREDFWWSQVWR
jgi:hypothetical protein